MNTSSGGKRRRIVQVLPTFANGGAEKMVGAFHEYLLAAGHESHLIALSGDARIGAGLVPLSSPHPRHPTSYFRLRSWFLEQQRRGAAPDVIHAHLFPDQFWSPFAARGLSPPPLLVATVHDSKNRLEGIPFGELFDRFLYGRFARIICVSESVRETLARRHPALEARLETILNGIDLQSISPRRHRSDANTVRVFSASRLVPQKDPMLLVSAMEKLGDQPCELSIAGDGPLHDELSARLDACGLSGRIRLLGYRSDIPDLLAQSDIFVLASPHEGFGLAVVEAMAAGLPVVATDIPPFREILGTDRAQPCATLVPPGDATAMAAAIRHLIETPSEARRMGIAAKARAARFCQESTFRATLEAYESLLARSGT